MGAFKSKKKIHVASTVYNLAGPEENRNNFLKLTLLGIVTSSSNLYVGENLTHAYLQGPGMQLRAFARWAKKSGYTDNVVRQTSGRLSLPASPDHSIIAQYINPSDPSKVSITLAELGIVEYNYWAMQYMLENHPDDLEGNWASSFNDTTNRVEIYFYNSAGTVINTETFAPTGYVRDARYAYVMYSIAQDGEEGDIEEGPVLIHGTGPHPSVTGWNQVSSTTTSKNYEIPTTIHAYSTFSDGRPPVETEIDLPNVDSKSTTNSVWDKVTYIGSLPDEDAVGNERQIQNLFQEYLIKEDVSSTTTTEDIGGGVIKTTTTTTTTRYLELNNTSRLDTQINKLKGWGPTKMLIYREDSGSIAMDSQFSAATAIGDFFPFIPVRLWNKFVNDTNYSQLYPHNKKALKKAVSSKYDDVLKTLADNPSLGDIDHAFITFGVSLNAKDNSSKRYIYEFFRQILEGYVGLDYQHWEDEYLDAQEKQAIWREWKEAQSVPSSPLFGTPEPSYDEVKYAPAMSVRLYSTHPDIDYDMTVSWSAFQESFHTGKYKPTAKKGDIEIIPGAPLQDLLRFNVGFTNIQTVLVEWRDPISIYWQHQTDGYRVMTIKGLNHRNVVYKGKSVTITAREALEDPDESGFIIPLHSELFRSTPMVHRTQMSQACAYMVLNSWQETKQKWYQRGAFKILLIIIVIVVAIYTGGLGASGSGLLGTNAAVGASIGFTGTAAVVAGAIANAIAAVVVSQVISAGATALFGEKWGAIIGTIATIFVLNMSANAAAGEGWTVNYEQLIKPDTLIRLTEGIGKGISQDIQAKAIKKFEETEAIIADYEEQSKRIAELYTKNIGDGTGIDLLAVQELASKFDFNYEAPADFLTRTLLTGTDLADMAISLIEDFPEISTSLNLP